MVFELLKRFFVFVFTLLRHAYKLGCHYIKQHTEQRRAQGTGKPIEMQGRLREEKVWRRAAVVALHDDTHAEPFIANLLNGLIENDFFVLVVSARIMPAAFKDSILSHCHHLIEKFSFHPNGSYKAGWDWINKNEPLKNIDALIFADDNLFYPRRIASTIGQMLDQHAHWISLFDYSQTSAQASFQLFRSSVFTAESFVNFWKNYTAVTNSFAQALQEAHFIPQAYYNTERLQSDVTAALDIEEVPVDLGDVLNLTLGFERRVRNNRGLPVKDALSLPAADVSAKVCRLAENGDPAHAIGLLCNYLYQAPVKRDICDQDHPNPDDLLALAQGFSADEKAAMANDLRIKQTTGGFSDFQKIPQRLLRMSRSA